MFEMMKGLQATILAQDTNGAMTNGNNGHRSNVNVGSVGNDEQEGLRPQTQAMDNIKDDESDPYREKPIKETPMRMAPVA